jgi:phosphate transport system substrate-binding protein
MRWFARRSTVRLISWPIAAALVFAGARFASAIDIVVPGTGDGLDMLRYVAAVYNERHPGTRIILPPSIGSEGGKSAVLDGSARLARVALPLTTADEAAGLVSVAVVRVPTAFFAHPSVNVTALSSEQVTRIFAGDIRNWREVGGRNLRIKVVLREEGDSTLQVLRATMRGWKNLALTERSMTVTRTHGAEEAVSRFEGAIAFGPYSKHLEAQFNVFKIDGHEPTKPDYPSFTTVRFIFKRDQFTDEMRKFLKFARLPEIGEIFRRYGAVPESDDDILGED